MRYLLLLFASNIVLASGESSIAEARASNRYSYIVFHRQEVASPALQELEAEASVIRVQVDSRREQALVKRFDAKRAPLPFVIALAPNGAVTGAFCGPLDAAAMKRAMVPPAAAACLKALQDKKVVLLATEPEAAQVARAAIEGNQCLRSRATCVTASPEECAFLRPMGVQQDELAARILILAPPARLVGSYDVASFSSETLVEDLGKAAQECCCPGGCCPGGCCR